MFQLEKEEPLVIAMTNGDNESAVKKIVLDPDNGIVVTQDKTRKKRSTREGNLMEWFGNVKVLKNQSLSKLVLILFVFLGYTMKKIVLDPDNGIVVTKDKTRKKRSTKKGNLIEWFVNVKASKNQLGLILFVFSGYAIKKIVLDPDNGIVDTQRLGYSLIGQ